MPTEFYAFEERGRGKGFFPGHSICIRATSIDDARNYAKSTMDKPVYRGKRCSGHETVAAVTDAARKEGRKTLYPDNPELWGVMRKRRRR